MSDLHEPDQIASGPVDQWHNFLGMFKEEVVLNDQENTN